jgi:hypothetical protein
MEFIPDGWEMTLVRPCERAFVRVGPSNRYKCSYLYQGQKDPVQIIKKTGRGYMCDSLVVSRRQMMPRHENNIASSNVHVADWQHRTRSKKSNKTCKCAY